jgi:signal transduction histidine kinase
VAQDLLSPPASLDLAFEALDHGSPVAMVDSGWRMVYANAGFERLFKIPPGSCRGRRLFETLPMMQADDAWAQLQQACQSSDNTVFEAHFPAGALWAEVRICRLSTGGRALFFTDISERHRRQQELQLLGEAGRRLGESLDLEETLQAIGALLVPAVADWYGVDLLDDGDLRSVAVAHRDPCKLAFAQQLRQRYPVQPDAPYGIYKVARTGEPDLVQRVDEAMLVNSAHDAEHLRLLRALALHSWMCVPLNARGQRLGVLTLVAAESGRAYGVEDLAFAQDLADRIALALDNARLYADAQQAVRVREDVLAVVSHDLKNPLAAINLSAAHLWQWATDSKARRLLENIQRTTGRMNRLLGDLLDMARIGSGQFDVEPGACPVAELLREAVELLQPVAEERKRLLQLDLKVVEGMAVTCDRGRILQVIENLLSNAIKFCRPGDLITLSAAPVGQAVRIAVADTGQGIPPEALPRLFDPYWSGQEHRKFGTGLGLYIGQGILAAHGGRLQVSSRVGKGSTFFFDLPLAEP